MQPNGIVFLPKQLGAVLELREHQKDARNWLNEIRSEGKTIALLNLATGVGKTVIESSKPRTPASVNRELCLLSKILALAVRDRKIADNPCRHVNLLSGEKSRTGYLSPDEESRLLPQLVGVRAHLCQL